MFSNIPRMTNAELCLCRNEAEAEYKQYLHDFGENHDKTLTAKDTLKRCEFEIRLRLAESRKAK
jgi:predicted DNA binding CopG/RHH family protein